VVSVPRSFPLDPRGRACCHGTVPLFRNPFGSRLRIPHELMDGSREPMASGSALPALGGTCSLRLRRGPFSVLSTGLMASWRDPRLAPALGPGSRGLHHRGTHALRLCDVPSRQRMVAAS